MYAPFTDHDLKAAWNTLSPVLRNEQRVVSGSIASALVSITTAIASAYTLAMLEFNHSLIVGCVIGVFSGATFALVERPIEIRYRYLAAAISLAGVMIFYFTLWLIVTRTGHQPVALASPLPGSTPMPLEWYGTIPWGFIAYPAAGYCAYVTSRRTLTRGTIIKRAIEIREKSAQPSPSPYGSPAVGSPSGEA